MRRNRSPRYSSSVSIASRVVPAMFETIIRCSPVKAFTRLDLPTFGRPTMASLTSSGSPVAAPLSGSFSTMRSSRSATPRPVQTGDGEHLAEAEGVELVRVEVAVGMVGLVHDHEDRAGEAPELAGEVLVVGVDPIHRVGEEQHHVGLGEGDVGLDADLLGQGIALVEDDAAGVDHLVALAVPLGGGVETVAGDAGLVLDHREALLDDAVEEGALADVRSTDDHHRRELIGHSGP